jgi:predicted dehydrogenase
VYTDHRELLNDPQVQAVVCVQPFHNNYRLGKQVLESGRALITEKPMVTRLDDGQELVEIARQQAVIYAVGFMKRYDPGVQLARRKIAEVVASGELGTLRMVDAYCFTGDWLENPGAPVTVDEPTSPPPIVGRYPDHIPPARHAAYDYVINVFAHNINLIRYLLPDEQLACVNGVLKGQALAVAFTSRDVIVSLRGVPSSSHGWAEETRFIFDKGYIAVKTPAPMNRQTVASVTVYKGDGQISQETRLQPEIDWSFRRQARGFVAALLGQEAPLAPGIDSLRDVALIEDIFRLAEIS